MLKKNHPKKGSINKVQPIKSPQDIEKIKGMLLSRGQIRNYYLFSIGINSLLMPNDLLRIKISDVKYRKSDDEFLSKRQKISLENIVLKYLPNLWDREAEDDELLFSGQRGPLTISSLCRLVKNWCGWIKLQGNYGGHSLRKTWGYHQHITYGVSIRKLMNIFCHNTQKQTIDYLCIQADDIRIEDRQNETTIK